MSNTHTVIAVNTLELTKVKYIKPKNRLLEYWNKPQYLIISAYQPSTGRMTYLKQAIVPGPGVFFPSRFRNEVLS